MRAAWVAAMAGVGCAGDATSVATPSPSPPRPVVVLVPSPVPVVEPTPIRVPWMIPIEVRTPPARSRAPCFPARPLLSAAAMQRQLEAIGSPDGEWVYPPPARFGTCTIEGGVLRDRRGHEIAALTCGIWVSAPGIVDDLGFAVGATGREIVAARGASADVACVSAGDDRARCWFPDAGDPEHQYGIDYYVRGAIDDGVLRSDQARTFFARRAVVGYHAREYCH